MITKQIIVYGKVQGVFYRQSTLRKAREMGITGTVENLPNGAVRMMATGTPDQLTEFIAWCKKGPPTASVNSVEQVDVAFQPFAEFSILRGQGY